LPSNGSKIPRKLRGFIWLALLTPAVLLASYPAVFIAGGVSAALAVPAWNRGWKSRAWFAVFNLTLLAGFLVASRISAAQLNTVTGMGTNHPGRDG